jgi:hypothetical protein
MDPSLKMERRMAALFVLALALIAWQAVRTKPAWPPAFEIATEAGEQVAPFAVPSWRPPLELPRESPERLALLEERAVKWPGVAGESTSCRAFVRFSSQHWAETRVERGQGRPAWQLLYLSGDSFLDDDDGNGDPLDAGELSEAGPGAQVEVFCGEAAP